MIFKLDLLKRIRKAVMIEKDISIKEELTLKNWLSKFEFKPTKLKPRKKTKPLKT